MAKERIKSLDVFRGAVMAAMVLVESPGNWNAYAPLRHAAQGATITPTDFIFPLFVFIMGIAVPLSLSKIRSGGLTTKLFMRITRRTIILFALGAFLKLYPHFDISLGIAAGVLQKIAIVYMLSSIIFLTMKPRSILILLATLLLGYWAMLTLIPVEGFQPPGFNREHNIVTLVDKAVFGHPTAEGILSTIGTLSTGLIGVLTGLLMQSPKEKTWKFNRLMIAGALTTALGLAWGTVFSLEKDLWTSPYTLYTAGVGMLLLGLFYWIIDIKKVDKWAVPFTAYGINCISAYVCAHLLMYSLWNFTATEKGQTISLWEKVMNLSFNRWFQPSMASLLFSLSMVILWSIPLLMMYRKKIIIKI